MTIQQAIERLKNKDIPVIESNRKGFDYFIPYHNDEIPITEEENESMQGFGTHLLEKEIIEFAQTI